MHKQMDYRHMWSQFQGKGFLECLITVLLFVQGILHLLRLSHYIPESFKGEYQLIAQKVLDRNQEELRLQNHRECARSDIIYENKYETEEIYFQETTFFDQIFSLSDLVI